MNLQSWLSEHKIENPVTVVTQIASGSPIKQYEVKVSGTEGGNPIIFLYVSIKDKVLADTVDVDQRRITYGELYTESIAEQTIADEALKQIKVFEPDPVPPPDPIP